MSEFSKAMKNKEGKAFVKHKDHLECVSNDDITDSLSELAVDRFRDNRRIIKRFRRILNLKLFMKYDIPLITLLIGSGMALKTPRDVSVVPYYNLEQTMISDDKLVQEVDDNNYITLPRGTAITGDFIELDEIKNVVQYQVKSGTRSAIVTVELGEDGGMEVVDSLVGNFFDRNSDIFEDVETTTLDEKYAELVEDIGDFVIESQSLSSTTKKEIQKLLESERVNIITTVAQYVQVGEVELEQTDSSWYGSVAFNEFLAVLVTVMMFILVKHLLDAGTIRALYVDNDKVKYEDREEWKVVPYTTYSYAKRAFVKADDYRRSEIKRLVKNNLSEESQKYFYK